MIATIVTALAVFLDGVLAGMFLCSGMVEQAMRTLRAHEWIAYKQAKEGIFAAVMPVLFNVGLLVTIAAAIVAPAHLLIAIAAILLAGSMAITLRLHLPLNARIMTWSADDHPADWDAARTRWRDWNWRRAYPVFVAFVLVLIATR